MFKELKKLRWLTIVFISSFLIFLPLWSGSFIIYLVSYSFIFGIFAMAYDLFFGYTGLVSFGHSTFLGMAAYAVGMFSKTLFHVGNPLLLFIVACGVGTFLGLLVGYFCTYTRGIYVALVTFAFAQISWLVVMTDPGGLTWGENGIVGVRPGPLEIGQLKLNLFSGVGLYYLVVGIFAISYLIIWAITRSQVGDIFKGIKQNEERLLSLGYNTKQYKILVFALSGFFSAIAGVLVSFLDNCVTPALVEWTLGAEILLITILGGPGTLVGPVLGSFLVAFSKFYVSSWIGEGNWVYLLGGLYIVVVMFLRGGIINSRTFHFLSGCS